MGLSYPGGPAIQAIALDGDATRFSLPKGRVSKPGGGFYPYDFSFSGLKTAMLRQVEACKRAEEPLPLADLAASFEQVVVDVLVQRSLRCCADQGLSTLVMVGGVAANQRLRRCMHAQGSKQGVAVHLAPLAYCTDNAAMVGAAAFQRLHWSGLPGFSSLQLGVSARWPLENCAPLYQSNPPF